jgi:hypothetical protein
MRWSSVVAAAALAVSSGAAGDAVVSQMEEPKLPSAASMQGPDSVDAVGKPVGERDPLGLGHIVVDRAGVSDLLQAFVYAPKAVRLEYMADEVEVRSLSDASQLVERVRKAEYQFKIGIDYNEWVLFGTGKYIDWESSIEKDLIRIDFVPVERNDDFKVIREIGPAGAYIFEYRKDRWQLTQELR